MNRINTYYADFERDIGSYLAAKLPNLPVCVLMEIIAYIGSRTFVLMNYVLSEQAREIRNEAKRSNRR